MILPSSKNSNNNNYNNNNEISTNPTPIPVVSSNKRKRNSCFFHCCFSVSYYIFLFLFVLSVCTIITSFVFLGMYLKKASQFIFISSYQIVTILGLVFGFPGCFLFGLGLLFLTLGYLVWSCSKLGKKGLGVHDHMSLDEVEEYNKKMQNENNVLGGGIYVNCYHYETRTRTVRTKKGRSTRRVRVKVSSFTHTFPITYTSIKDNSKIPNLREINSHLIEVKSSLEIHPDQTTGTFLKKLVENVKTANSVRDTYVTCYRKNHTLPNFKKTIRFSKSGELPREAKYLENPLGSIIGLFCWLSCCIIRLRVSFVDKFIVTNYNIVKDVSINEEMRAKLTTEHTMGLIDEQKTKKIENQMKNNQQIIENNQKMLEQQQKMMENINIVNSNINSDNSSNGNVNISVNGIDEDNNKIPSLPLYNSSINL